MVQKWTTCRKIVNKQAKPTVKVLDNRTLELYVNVPSETNNTMFNVYILNVVKEINVGLTVSPILNALKNTFKIEY